MATSDKLIQDLLDAMELSTDLRKAQLGDVDKIDTALSFKLNHSNFDIDPKGFTEELSETIDEHIESALKEMVGNDRSQRALKEKLEASPEFKSFASKATIARRSLSKLINHIKNEQPDQDSLELAELALNTVNDVNDLLINLDVVPLIKRGIYSSDITSALKVWREKHKSEADNEGFWHSELETRKGVLERLLGGYAIFRQSEFHVGVTDTKGRGSKRADFALQHKLIENITLIEIKSPGTNLLGNKYRDTYPLSRDVSGGISQALLQRNEIMINHHQKANSSEFKFESISPRCILIIGNLDSIKTEKEKLKAFELQRQAISSHVTIITFDELYEQFATFNQL